MSFVSGVETWILCPRYPKPIRWWVVVGGKGDMLCDGSLYCYPVLRIDDDDDNDGRTLAVRTYAVTLTAITGHQLA